MQPNQQSPVNQAITKAKSAEQPAVTSITVDTNWCDLTIKQCAVYMRTRLASKQLIGDPKKIKVRDLFKQQSANKRNTGAAIPDDTPQEEVKAHHECIPDKDLDNGATLSDPAAYQKGEYESPDGSIYVNSDSDSESPEEESKEVYRQPAVVAKIDVKKPPRKKPVILRAATQQNYQSASNNNRQARRKRLSESEWMHLYYLLTVHGSDQSYTFVDKGSMFSDCQPAYVERLVYTALRCTNKPPYSKLQLNFFKIAVYNDLKYEDALACNKPKKVHQGKYRNPYPSNKLQMAAHRDWLLEHFAVKEEELIEARNNLQQMSKFERIQPFYMPGTTPLEKLTYLYMLHKKIRTKHAKVLDLSLEEYGEVQRYHFEQEARVQQNKPRGPPLQLEAKKEKQFTRQLHPVQVARPVTLLIQKVELLSSTQFRSMRSENLVATRDNKMLGKQLAKLDKLQQKTASLPPALQKKPANRIVLTAGFIRKVATQPKLHKDPLCQ